MTETDDDERKRGEMLLKKFKSANEKLHNACLFGDRLLLEEAITDGAEVGLPFASSVGEEDEFGTGKMHSLLPLHCADGLGNLSESRGEIETRNREATV